MVQQEIAKERRIVYKMENLTGKQFGEWTVLKYAGNYKWTCKCSCGVIRDVSRGNLISGDSTSCGHNSNKDQLIDLKGMQIGELSILGYDKGKKKWECICSCGQRVYKRSWDLRNNKATTCGDKSRHTSKKLLDLKGEVVGELTVLEYAGERQWKCKCSCGKIVTIDGARIRNRSITTCGHGLNQFKREDLSGKTFGKLHVDEYIWYGKYKCTCECGNNRDVSANDLKNGKVTACGLCTETRLRKAYEASRIDLTGQQFGDLKVIAYNTSNHKWICKCSCGNTIEVYGQHLRRGDTRSCGCKYGISGYTRRSYLEEEVAEYIRSVYKGEVINNTRGLLSNRREVDIYLPELKIAFEINGTYWHNDEHKAMNYHQNKVIELANKGIRLIHIYEYEWRNQENEIKQFINNVISRNNIVIYARNTTLVEVDTSTVKQFENQYHLQRYAKSEVNIALKGEDNDIIGIMTFGKPRFNRHEQWEIIRLAYKSDVRVIGGTQKMFRYFINKFNPLDIITYTNLDKFTGNTYKELGFKESGITKPGYVWVNATSKDVLQRYATTKQKLVDIGAGNENETEDVIMKRLGYNKIYNSGNKIFIYRKAE